MSVADRYAGFDYCLNYLVIFENVYHNASRSMTPSQPRIYTNMLI